MKKFASAAILASAMFATPALANDGGPWVAGIGGYDRMGVEIEGERGSEDGMLYGIAAGYDARIGNVLLGAEFEASDTSTKTSGTDLLATGDALSIHSGRDLYAGLRLGVPLGKTLTGYVKGGYSNAAIDSTYRLNNVVEKDTATQGGYRLGAGLEMNLGKPFLRLEYRYSNYGDFDDSGIDVDRHQVALSAGVRF